MSAEIIDAFDGVVTIQVRGKLGADELAAVHREAAASLREWSGGSLLILAEEFEGWSDDCDWADLSFQTANDPLVRKMALLGDPRWEQLALLFTAKGLRPFPIEFFGADQEPEARAWLKS